MSMASRPSRVGGELCLSSDCAHPPSDHTPTPELAGPAETVVWCAGCRRHEVTRPSRFRFPWTRHESGRSRRRFSGPA
jgi:hypothetical protein